MGSLKVAFIVSALVNKGVITYVRDLIHELEIKGCECHIFYFDKDVEIHFDCYSERISLYHKIDFNSYHIIHSHSLRPNLYVFLHRRKSDTAKFITTIHSYIKQDLEYTYNVFVSFVFFRIWNILLVKQDLLVCLTEDAKKYYKNLLLNKRITSVHTGRTNGNIYEDIGIEDQEIITTLKSEFIIIGANAVITHIKGLEQILDFLADNTNYAFITVGDGKDRQWLELYAKKLDVSDRCLFLGYRNDAIRYLKYYDIYAMPSRSEGFPLALLEAVSNKVPVIASNLNVFKEIFPDSEITLFDLDNKSSLKGAFELLKNPDYRDAVVNNAYKKYLYTYTAEAMADRYLSVYRKLLINYKFS